MKAQLAVREALVRTRAKHIVLVGALVRQQGPRIATGNADEFLVRFDRVALPEETKPVLTPLVSALKTLNELPNTVDFGAEKKP